MTRRCGFITADISQLIEHALRTVTFSLSYKLNGVLARTVLNNKTRRASVRGCGLQWRRTVSG